MDALDFQIDAGRERDVSMEHKESSTQPAQHYVTNTGHIRLGSGITDMFLSAARIGIGGLLIYTSIVKIMHPYQFLSQIYNYEITGPLSGVLAAITVTSLELTCGLCLVTGLQIGGAILGSVLLFSIFTVAQASVIIRGLSISCGCFNLDPEDAGLIGYATLIRTMLLLLLSGIIFVRIVGDRYRKSLLFAGV